MRREGNSRRCEHRDAGLRPGSPLLSLRCRCCTRNGCAWRSSVQRRRRRRHRHAFHARRSGLQAGLGSLRFPRRTRAPAPLRRRSHAPKAGRDRSRGGLASGREACRCVAPASRTLIAWQCTFWHRRGRPAAPRARSRSYTAARSAARSARVFGPRQAVVTARATFRADADATLPFRRLPLLKVWALRCQRWFSRTVTCPSWWKRMTSGSPHALVRHTNACLRLQACVDFLSRRHPRTSHPFRRRNAYAAGCGSGAAGT